MSEKRSIPRAGTLVRSNAKQWGLITLSALMMTLILVGALSTLHYQQASRAAASSSSGDWLTYMNSVKRQGFNGAETVINATSAPNLKQHWTHQAGGNIFAQPVVSNSVIYWGSLDGYEHATNLKGVQIWQQNLGVRTTC